MNDRNLVKSKDFLAGYIYESVERQVARALCKDKEEQFPVKWKVSIPWSWCYERDTCNILSGYSWRCAAEYNLLEVSTLVSAELKNTFHNARLDISACVLPADKGWRSEVCFEIHQESEVKEMTVAEIEAALGYKVKIVGDK